MLGVREQVRDTSVKFFVCMCVCVKFFVLKKILGRQRLDVWVDEARAKWAKLLGMCMYGGGKQQESHVPRDKYPAPGN